MTHPSGASASTLLTFYEGSLTAVDLPTGAQRWTFELPVKKRLARMPTMAIAAGRVFVCLEKGELFCLAEQTGAPLWRQQLEGSWGRSAHEALMGVFGHHLVLSQGGVLRCLDLDGRVLWEQEREVSAMGVDGVMVEYRESP